MVLVDTYCKDLAVDFYSLGKDISELIRRIEQLENKLDSLTEEIEFPHTTEFELHRMDSTNEVDSVRFAMTNINAGPAYAEGILADIYRDDHWHVDGVVRNASQHSTSEITYRLLVRDQSGTTTLLEILVMADLMGPGGRRSNFAGTRSTLGSYVDRLRSGECTLYGRITRQRRG